jgi:hypothetical protein
VAPERHMFKWPGEEKRFTLCFPVLPKSWKVFDLVEKTGDNEGFVYRNIKRNDSGVYKLSLGK